VRAGPHRRRNDGDRKEYAECDGRVEEVRVTSEAGALLPLANPWGEAAVRVGRAGGAETVTGVVLELRTSAGETRVLKPA
jgi:hypothetical protein